MEVHNPNSYALIVGFVAAFVSVVGAVLSYRSARKAAAEQKQLEDHRAALALSLGRDAARRDYEFQALKRLYNEAEPLLFQLYEDCDYELNRLRNFARAAKSGQLAPALTDPKSYYFRSTLHSLLVPLASGHILRERLTLTDLTLDPKIERQYNLVKAMNQSYNRDFDFAKQQPTIHHAQDSREGIYAGEVQCALRAVIKGDDAKTRTKSFAEFEQDLGTQDNPALNDVRGFVAALKEFTPTRRRVFWRILMAHLFLCRAARLYRQPNLSNDEIIQRVALSEAERVEFSYSDSPEEVVFVDASFRIGLEYLESILIFGEPFRAKAPQT